MNHNHYLLVALLALSGCCVSCSQTTTDSSTPAPAPQEDLVAPLVGVYTLTKVTTSGGSPVVTGVGSLTIGAVDKTTAAITQIASFTNTSTGATKNISSVKGELNKIEKSGGNYLVKTANGLQWAIITGTKMLTDESMSGTPTTSLTLNTEYTK